MEKHKLHIDQIQRVHAVKKAQAQERWKTRQSVPQI
jgi:hypothetical protein